MKFTLIEWLIVVAMFIPVLWWSLTKSDEPGRLIVRWIVTFLMLGGMFKIGVPGIMEGGQAGAIVGILIIASCAIIIGITWASNWTGIMLSPLTDAFDGGDVEQKAKALYSAAEAKRKRGHFHEAIQEIHKQLEVYPYDFHGLLMLAEIQAQNFQDLAAAQVTVDLISDTHKEMPSQVSAAYMAMGDWYLKESQVEEARRNFERINELFPNTSFSQLAAQRIAHLENAQHTIDERTRSIVVQDNRGKYPDLQKSSEAVNTDSEPAVLAAEYVAHLRHHPLDIEARQKLAVLYAEKFQRIDMAQLEFEQLIAQPNQSQKQVAQHLNLMADWQLKSGNGDTARKTLQRIVQLFPGSALANAAETRMAYLGNEMKAQKSQASVKLGSYKKDLGLNRDY
ncbi:MAG: hypothetical protein JWM68_2365 [Verrucomicrobiales bacterium]|nr:hypothetical protein [Verrucomicrobiales bacterium]